MRTPRYLNHAVNLESSDTDGSCIDRVGDGVQVNR